MGDLKYLVVIDFQGTVSKETIFMDPEVRKSEIIEFPGVLFNIETGSIESEFRAFVKPTENPILSEYCEKLTGITQAQVDAAQPLPIVLSQFDIWLKDELSKRGLNLPLSFDSRSSANCALAAWYICDFRLFLGSECQRKSISMPGYFKIGLDLNGKFKEVYKGCDLSFKEALTRISIYPESEQHWGLCDARNATKLAFKLAQEGAKFQSNEIAAVSNKYTFYTLRKAYREHLDSSSDDDFPFNYESMSDSSEDTYFDYEGYLKRHESDKYYY